MPEETKTCSKCQESKALDQFSKHKSKPDGHQYHCKACEKARTAAHYAKNREQIKEKHATYNAENREQNNARNAAYHAEHREQINAKRAVYHAENRDERAAYRQTPKGKFTNYKGNAKTRAISFELSFDEFMTFWKADCNYCKRPIPTIGLDRVDSGLGYTVDNVVPCCTVCNTMKLDHSLEEWQTNMLMALKGMGVI